MEQIEDLDPNVIVEIGTAEGGSLYPWVRAVEPSSVISVDTTFLNRNLEFYTSFNTNKETKISLIKANSQSQSTRDKLLELLDDQEIDFLFIDADHQYDGVKKDFELYEPLVREGGVIAFHDILGENEVIGVGKLWQEVEPKYESETIISEDRKPLSDATTGGIGLIKKPE